MVVCAETGKDLAEDLVGKYERAQRVAIEQAVDGVEVTYDDMTILNDLIDDLVATRMELIQAYEEIVALHKSETERENKRGCFADRLYDLQEWCYGSWWRHLRYGKAVHRIVLGYLDIYCPDEEREGEDRADQHDEEAS